MKVVLYGSGKPLRDNEIMTLELFWLTIEPVTVVLSIVLYTAPD